MDITKFDPNGPEFRVLDLFADFRFKTTNSIGFALGRWNTKRPIWDGSQGTRKPGGVFTGVGQLEVHHPSDGHVKVHMTVSLPESYHSWESMRSIIDQAFAALAIPEDETFEAYFIAPAKGSLISQRRDRNGVSDELVSSA